MLLDLPTTLLDLLPNEIIDSIFARVGTSSDLRLASRACRDSHDSSMTSISMTFRAGIHLSDDVIAEMVSRALKVTNLVLAGSYVEGRWPFTNVACLVAPRMETTLTYLKLKHTRVTDVAPLASLMGLKCLKLTSNKIVDVAPLASLTGLTCLKLTFNRIVNVAPLASLTGLTCLTLGYNSLVDVAPLASLTALTHIDLMSNRLIDASAMASLTALTHLNLRENEMVGPLDKVWNGCTSLAYVNLAIMELDEDCMPSPPMPVCKSLRELVLFNNDFVDLSRIAHYENLEWLCLDDNQDIVDLSPLSRLTKLNHLSLDMPMQDPDVGVVDVSPLATCTALTYLSFEDQCHLVDVSALAALTALKQLNISGTSVTDVSALAALTGLKYNV